MTDVRGEAPAARSMSALDVIALAIAALGLAAAWALQIFVAPAFVRMFAELGVESLPAITQLVLTRPIAVSVMSVVVLSLAGTGIAIRFARPSLLAGLPLGAAPVIAWLTVVMMIYAIYSPIFELR